MSLPALLRLVARCQPGLDGQVGAAPADWLRAGGASPPLDALLVYWRQAQPEAGPLYWASRSWTMLVWQPLYLLVWSLHQARAVPRLASLGQRVQAGVVAGFSLAAHRPWRGAWRDGLPLAGREAQAVCQPLLADLQRQLPLHPKMAARLQADCLLSALLNVLRRHPVRDGASVPLLAAEWLAACGLSGQSSLRPLALPDGSQGWGLARQVCCQHFRCHGATLCASCPKLPPAERQARQCQEWQC